MSSAYKMSFLDMPESVDVPHCLRHKKVDLIFLSEEPKDWDPGFFDTTFGSISDMVREDSGPYEERELL